MRSATLNVRASSAWARRPRSPVRKCGPSRPPGQAARSPLGRAQREPGRDLRNGHAEHCLPNTLNVSFAYVEGEALMMVSAHRRSAAAQPAPAPRWSRAMCSRHQRGRRSGSQFDPLQPGPVNTAAEIEQAIDQVVTTVRRLREMSPLYEMAKEGVDLKSVDWTKA